MFDLRFVERNGKKILQWRKVECQIGWSKGDDHPVIQPANPINFNPEKNWSPWEDVKTESECGCPPVWGFHSEDCRKRQRVATAPEITAKGDQNV